MAINNDLIRNILLVIFIIIAIVFMFPSIFKTHDDDADPKPNTVKPIDN